ESSIFSCDCEEWMIEYSDVAVHPGVEIAAHRDGNLLARESFLQRRPWGLKLVPLTIVRRSGMNIVRGVVAVQDLQFLVGLQRNHVRRIHAAFLLDRDGIAGDVESAGS